MKPLGQICVQGFQLSASIEIGKATAGVESRPHQGCHSDFRELWTSRADALPAIGARSSSDPASTAPSFGRKFTLSLPERLVVRSTPAIKHLSETSPPRNNPLMHVFISHGRTWRLQWKTISGSLLLLGALWRWERRWHLACFSGVSLPKKNTRRMKKSNGFTTESKGHPQSASQACSKTLC